MRWRSHATSIVLTLLAGAALVYAYADRGSITEGEKKTRAGNVFPAWRREDVTRLVIEHGSERIVLERSKDDAGEPEWWMRSPRDEKANSEGADKLSSAMEFAGVARKVDLHAGALGLESPRARGEVAMGGVSYRFALGGEAPTPPGAGYLQVEGQGPVVVSRDFVQTLLQGPEVYRSRKVVPYLSIALARLEREGGGGPLSLTRADDVSFKFTGSGLRASRPKLDTLWGALADARAEVFLTDAVADPLVASPKVTLTMTPTGGAAPGILRVGGACPGNEDDVVLVRDAPSRLSTCAPKGILPGLEVAEVDLIDTRLFAAHDDEVTEVRIESVPPGRALELARKDGAWREKAPEERDLAGEDAEQATALVTGLAQLEGAHPKRSDAPIEAVARVTLRRAGDDVAEVVELGAPDAKGGAVVRRAFDGARLEVDASTARKLVPRGVALRGKEVWNPRIEGAEVTTLETRCEGVEQRAEHGAEGWKLIKPGAYAADNTSIVDLIDAVTRVRAESWVADGDDGRFGFGVCAIALTLNTDGGPRVVRVDLGGDADGGVYAKTGDDPAIWVASKALRDRARGWLIDLHGLAPPKVEEVTLEKGGKTLSFRADAGADESADAVLSAANVLKADGV
ncbi:MAG TPA: DUF4340 domain-containing protein, partial [Polyangiaceae bacterium]